MKGETLQERFFGKVFFHSNGCWIWLGGRMHGDYGKFWFENRTWAAHQWAFLYIRGGTIPQGLELGHICHNPNCVNPWHVKPITHSENVLDSDVNVPAINRAKTHCINGHPYSGNNLYIRPNGKRECRFCMVGREVRRRRA